MNGSRPLPTWLIVLSAASWWLCRFPRLVEPEVVRTPWFGGWRLAWVGVPALAALILLVVFFRGGPVQKPAVTQMATIEQATPPPAPMPSSPALALRKQAPLRKNLQRLPSANGSAAPEPGPSGTVGGVAGGVMGGILGGVGREPTPSISVAGHPAMPAFALASRSAVDGFSAARALPSHLAALSMVSFGSRRLAIDTSNQVFLSGDDGRHWQAVPAQWQGRAVRVALVGASSSSPATALKVSSLPAAGGAASITGTVTDPAGAFIAGTTVAATDANGAVVRAVTGQQGQFRLEHLAPGGYRVEAEKPGFEKQALTTNLAAAQQAVVDVTLQLGAAAQTVTVQESASAADKLSAVVVEAGPGFELTTADGSRWVSADGLSWARK